MEENEINSLLQSWGLQSFADVFAANCVDLEALHGLDEDMIKELLPQIGPRSKFKLHLKKYLQAMKQPDSDGAQTIEISCPVLFEMPPSINDTEDGENLIENLDGNTENVIEVLEENFENAKQESIKMKRKKTVLTFPTPLPELSSMLKVEREKGSLLKKSTLFIRECGHFLMSQTNGHPTSQDYAAYSQTIISKYPEFADHLGCSTNDSVRIRLTNFCRNTRCAEKKKNGIRNSPAPSTSTSKVSPSATEMAHMQENVQDDIDALLAELKKQGSVESQHVKILLKSTSAARRQAVKAFNNEQALRHKHAKFVSTSLLVEEFPHLGNYKMLIYDFTLMFDVQMEETFATVVKKLCKIFSKEAPDDVAQLKLLQELEMVLHPRRLKDNRPAIVIEPAGGQINLSTSPTQSPCILAYHSDGVIAEVFLLAQGETICQASGAVTALQVLQLLVASYYLFDIGYPTYYESFLNFWSAEWLKEKSTKSGKLAYVNFIKKFKLA